MKHKLTLNKAIAKFFMDPSVITSEKKYTQLCTKTEQ